MKIAFKKYQKKNGDFMLYINNNRNCSIGTSEEKGIGGQYYKKTKGEGNLVKSLHKVLENAGEKFQTKPKEEPTLKLDIGDVYFRDNDGIILYSKYGQVIDLTKVYDEDGNQYEKLGKIKHYKPIDIDFDSEYYQ